MAIEVTEFKEKRYTIDDCVFKLKKPTLGIKRKGHILASLLFIKVQELAAISNKYEKGIEKTSKKVHVDSSVYAEYYMIGEKINSINDEIFIKGEELLKIILEPVNEKDIAVLVADNLDIDTIVMIANDFFQIAGLSTRPAKK
jgi:hypothetical protein